MSSKQIDLICFGELLWDLLPTGKVAGGAPYNIVNRAGALGLNARVISSVGNDILGEELVQLVANYNNSTDFIQRHPSLPTSVVEIKVGPGGEPQYDIVAPVAWDDIVVDPPVKSVVSSSRAFVYSSLGLRDERSREVLFSLLPLAQLKICDINLREGHYIQETIMRMVECADILRTNESELSMIARWCGMDHLNRKDQMKELSKLYNYHLVIATLGGEGAVAYHQDNWYVQPVFKVDVKDTVGAGDAFLAAFIFYYLRDHSIPECLRYACAVGAITASKDGGTPEIFSSEIVDILSQ